jgi:ferredoxin-NADP reductase
MSVETDEISYGIPWLDQPIRFHSLRNIHCMLSQADCEYRSGKWRYWYTADLVYARGTIYFCCALIALFALIHLLKKWSSPQKRSTIAARKLYACVRFVEYKGYRINSLKQYSPTLGVMLVLVIGMLFFFFMTLGPQPYFWPNTKEKIYGSAPPIATRTGWLALGLLPFILQVTKTINDKTNIDRALGSKQNLITTVTGVSHEKLQVFHQWASYAMFVLALIHTVPYIIFHVWKGDMELAWNTQLFYWTGAVALAAQGWLTFASLAPFRKRHYEFFKFSHIFASLVFFVILFFHCDFRLTSWDYFIVSAALYIPTLIYSQIKTHFMYGWSHKAVITPLPSGMLQVVIPTHYGGNNNQKPAMNISWRPGQHVFIRFLTLGMNALSAHPFSICSLPPAKDKRDPSSLVLYIRPEGGFTKRLALLAQKTPKLTIPILLDGPYGGLGVETLAAYDRVLIIAGGSGAGFSLPIIEDILFQKDYRQRGEGHVTRIQVILATRSQEVRAWYASEIQRLLMQYLSAEFLQVEIYITDKLAQPAVSEDRFSLVKDAKEANAAYEAESPSSLWATDWPLTPSGHSATSPISMKDAESPSSPWGSEFPLKSPSSPWGAHFPLTHHSTTKAVNVLSGRPGVRRAVEEATATPQETVGIAVCGPAGLVYEAREAAAEAQSRILAGKGASEVYLHTESFS